MTINYKGMTPDYEYRIAEINFDADTEQSTYDRLEKVMNLKGWKLNCTVEGWASCEVADYNEYKDFVKDYKEVKKSVKLWEKFNI